MIVQSSRNVTGVWLFVWCSKQLHLLLLRLYRLLLLSGRRAKSACSPKEQCHSSFWQVLSASSAVHQARWAKCLMVGIVLSCHFRLKGFQRFRDKSACLLLQEHWKAISLVVVATWHQTRARVQNNLHNAKQDLYFALCPLPTSLTPKLKYLCVRNIFISLGFHKDKIP